MFIYRLLGRAAPATWKDKNKEERHARVLIKHRAIISNFSLSAITLFYITMRYIFTKVICNSPLLNKSEEGYMLCDILFNNSNFYDIKKNMRGIQ